MLYSNVDLSANKTFEIEATQSNFQKKSTGQTSEISIAVQTLGAELEQDIGNIEHTQITNRSLISRLKKETPKLTLLCDIAASTLSYSAAIAINSNSLDRAITSGAAWAAAGLFSGVEHTFLASKKMLAAILADATCFGAGANSMVSGLLSKHGQTQSLINGAAYLSNTLWVGSGALSNIAVLRGEYNQAVDSKNLYVERTAKTLIHLAGLADILAGVTGLISTAKTNGSSAPLNALSSNFWMTSSLLKSFSYVLQAQLKNLERTPATSAAHELKMQLQEQAQKVERQSKPPANPS